METGSDQAWFAWPIRETGEDEREGNCKGHHKSYRATVALTKGAQIALGGSLSALNQAPSQSKWNRRIYIPPKSGRRRTSYPFSNLSTISLTTDKFPVAGLEDRKGNVIWSLSVPHTHIHTHTQHPTRSWTVVTKKS